MQKNNFITINSKQTQKLGEMLAQELKGGEIICLKGELGAGKTTFTQGLLRGLRIKGPYTSPTFVIMKQYEIKNQESVIKNQNKLQKVYHFDAYRIEAEDILNLGWEEIVTDRKNIVIIEWANRVEKIIPKKVIWINFEWLDEKKRKISLNLK